MKSKDQILLEEAYEATKQGVSKNPYDDPFIKLIVRIRHATKTGDKAKKALAQSELETLAKKHNKMKDPEVLEALEEAYTSINKVITEEETPMTPTKTEQPTGSNVVYVLVLEVDYEGETVYGIYTSPEAAEKALAEVESKSMHTTSDANFVIKKTMLNSSPSNTCLE